MSRGNREASLGNLKNSMRDNYTEHGVDEVSVRIGVVDRTITNCAHRHIVLQESGCVLPQPTLPWSQGVSLYVVEQVRPLLNRSVRIYKYRVAGGGG